MTLYRKVFTKDRLPPNGYVVYNTDTGLTYGDHIHESTCEWWFEEIELPTEDDVYSVSESFKTAEGMNGFEKGANYILNKLKG